MTVSAFIGRPPAPAPLSVNETVRVSSALKLLALYVLRPELTGLAAFSAVHAMESARAGESVTANSTAKIKRKQTAFSSPET